LLIFLIVDTRRVYGQVLDIYVAVGLGVFVAFTLAIVGPVLIYRRRQRAARWHEANRIEIGYAMVLTCVAAFLLAVTFSGEHKEDVALATERPAVTIDVIGARWEWIFRYPGSGIERESGAVGDQTVVVPTNVAVRFRLRSVDVIHAFWIPQLRFKRDAMPGTTESIILNFDHTGRFGGSCAEFCGLLHADMVFTVDAVKPTAFKAWLASSGKRPA
jgi:cytochrome c oxidase subunit 2